MEDKDKTQEQLINELVDLRQRVTELEAADIERKRAEEMLRESEERFRELVENANDIIYTHDLQGNFTSVNPAATRSYGYTAEEILQLNIAQIVDSEYLPLARQKIREKLEGSPRTGPYELLTYSKEGEPIWVEVSTRLLGREGQPVEVQGIARDITKRKRVEKEREKLIVELQEALANVKTLRGLIPICASCKKIRDDEGYWHQVEAYIRDHAEVEFTHGICPDCLKKLYPEYYKGDG